jgi:hypothetical protein
MYRQCEERTNNRKIKNECNYTSTLSIRKRVPHRLNFSKRKTFRRKKALGKPRSKWQDAVWKHVVDLSQIRNLKVAERKREVWRKEIGKAIARKQAEAAQKKTRVKRRR